MMKKILSTTGLLFALVLLNACSGTKNPVASTPPATHMEFDSQTGAWKPVTKVVAAPPSQGGAVIVEPKKPGMMQKIGDTMKKPLKWVGLGKDEPKPEAKP